MKTQYPAKPKQHHSNVKWQTCLNFANVLVEVWVFARTCVKTTSKVYAMNFEKVVFECICECLCVGRRECVYECLCEGIYEDLCEERCVGMCVIGS